MDSDREWTKIKRNYMIGIWTTRLALVMLVIAGAALLWNLLTAQWDDAAVWFAITTAIFLTHRWDPSLLKIRDFEDEE